MGMVNKEKGKIKRKSGHYLGKIGNILLYYPEGVTVWWADSVTSGSYRMVYVLRSWNMILWERNIIWWEDMTFSGP